ncbi:MAG TPA: phosphatase PAP2 family protein [Candidatus Limnocylindrales bacterium]|nr:phosphatase PAP2 family protein [Candidatus Limnocylindrales bacterium]
MTVEREPASQEPGESAPGSRRRRSADRAAGAWRRLTATPSRRFGLATAGATIVLGAVYGLFVLTGSGQRLENIALMGAQLRRDAVREESLAYLSQVSIVSYAAAIFCLVAIAFLRRRLGLGALVGLVMGGSVVVAEVLKDVLPRPELVTGPAWILRNDFPSGHATIAASIGIGALLVAPDRLRWVVLPLGAAFAAVIGQSSQITGWHRMSGAAGGVTLVIAASCAALFLLARRGYVQPTQRGRIHPRLRAAILVVPAGAFVVAAAALALLVAFPLLQAPRDADAVFLHTVFELLGFGFTIVAFVAFAAVIEPFSLGRFERAGVAPRAVEPDLEGASAASDEH